LYGSNPVLAAATRKAQGKEVDADRNAQQHTGHGVETIPLQSAAGVNKDEE
jgi:hypothetical protein